MTQAPRAHCVRCDSAAVFFGTEHRKVPPNSETHRCGRTGPRP
jgi:hypothetical protein